MNDDSSYFMEILPALLNFILYAVASICMLISYIKLKGIGRQSDSKPLSLLATGFGFYFVSFLVGVFISSIGLAFAQHAGMIAYRGIQYSNYIFTIIGTIYFVRGAKQFFTTKS
jgi:hypothetical protein